MNIIDPISIMSVPLRLESHNGQQMGTATGFFWRGKNNKTYLISNYHVFSGNHYATNACLRQDSAFPSRLSYPRLISQRSPDERSVHTITLCDQAGNDPVWKTHPIHERVPVDIAAIEVPSQMNDGSYVSAVNDDPMRECDKALIRYHPGFEMMLAGFFLKDRPTGYFPTYIRGSVASEVDALYHGKRAFLIDALTSSGMSGSPVFSIGLEMVDPGNKWSLAKTTPPFVGIYSGRIKKYEGARERELQVGIVWRRELIQQMIEVLE